ncbi:MAG: LuxR family transcriptional regulator [Prevotella sp.]|nr:LuxR family transcriptional regulator [Prevotella sp.]
MEAVEFYLLDGQTCYMGSDGVGKRLTPQDREVVEFLLERIGQVFPEALKALKKWAEKSRPNKYWYEFMIVDRFVRCNLGEAEFTHKDINDMGMFQMEEVKCPLRGSGYCPLEGLVCKPKPSLGLHPEESKAAMLYAKGYLPGEIAAELGKSESTIKSQLFKVCKKLHLPHPRWLIRIYSCLP